jgi:hypothetical protein
VNLDHVKHQGSIRRTLWAASFISRIRFGLSLRLLGFNLQPQQSALSPHPPCFEATEKIICSYAERSSVGGILNHYQRAAGLLYSVSLRGWSPSARNSDLSIHHPLNGTHANVHHTVSDFCLFPRQSFVPVFGACTPPNKIETGTQFVFVECNIC